MSIRWTFRPLTVFSERFGGAADSNWLHPAVEVLLDGPASPLAEVEHAALAGLAARRRGDRVGRHAHRTRSRRLPARRRDPPQAAGRPLDGGEQAAKPRPEGGPDGKLLHAASINHRRLRFARGPAGARRGSPGLTPGPLIRSARQVGASLANGRCEPQPLPPRRGVTPPPKHDPSSSGVRRAASHPPLRTFPPLSVRAPRRRGRRGGDVGCTHRDVDPLPQLLLGGRRDCGHLRVVRSSDLLGVAGGRRGWPRLRRPGRGAPSDLLRRGPPGFVGLDRGGRSSRRARSSPSAIASSA